MTKKCPIVILPSEGWAPFSFSVNRNGGLFLSEYYSPMKNMGDYFACLYIISDDEIKQNDWCLLDNNIGESTGYVLDKCIKVEPDGWYYFKDCKTGRCNKIIATTNPALHADKISRIPEELELALAMHYNRSESAVIDVEYELTSWGEKLVNEFSHPEALHAQPKLLPGNKISILI